MSEIQNNNYKLLKSANKWKLKEINKLIFNKELIILNNIDNEIANNYINNNYLQIENKYKKKIESKSKLENKNKYKKDINNLLRNILLVESYGLKNLNIDSDRFDKLVNKKYDDIKLLNIDFID
jgi:hypothetical protein